MKKMRITVMSIIVSVTVLTIGFLLLWYRIDAKSTEMVEELIENQMSDAVESRAEIIKNYVSSVEEYMIAFAQSDEVKDVLRSNGAAKETARGQKYTEDFAKIKGVFEGLYIASTETYLYTHSDVASVGITTRPGDQLAPFQQDVMTEEKVTNYGIMKSRGAGGEMCISMYYPVFENNKCIGYVGGAVYAKNLMDSLESIKVEGLPDSEYVFLNTNTGEYLYNKDSELLSTVTEDSGYLQMIDEIKSNPDVLTGTVKYQDDNGVDQVVVYRNIPERGWVFALKDTKANVFSSLNGIRKTTAIMCIVISVLVIICIIFVMSMIGKAFGRISDAIVKLGDMDLEADKAMTGNSLIYEVDTICKALSKTCNNLRTYINEVGIQLATMARGDFTRKSNVKFAGDFVNLKNSMDDIQVALRNSFGEMSTVTSELVSGSQSVADSASQLADAANRSNLLVAEIDENVADISNKVASSVELAETAKNESRDASLLVKECSDKMDELSLALTRINNATSEIAGISNKLEKIAKQTNILALNAVVEAGAAGKAGRGFSVVANEIRVLAEESGQASIESFNIINDVMDAVLEGIRLGELTAGHLEKVVAQTELIDDSVVKIAEESNSQNEKLKTISRRLVDISQVVEITAGMSQQCASASTELDGQTNVLMQTVGNYIV